MKPTRHELIALAIVTLWSLMVVIVSDSALDFQVYLNVARGQPFYYLYIILPVWQLLDLLPLTLGWLVWNLINIMGLWAGGRLLKAPTVALLLSGQCLFVLAHGQMAGLLVLGLGLTAWGLKHQKIWAIGLGVTLLTIKPQYGLLVVAFICQYRPAWRVLVKALFIPLVLYGLSLVMYPGWPLEWWDFLRHTTPYNFPNISLWQYIGPIVLVGWVILGNRRMQTPSIVAALLVLTAPYFPSYDLLLWMALVKRRWVLMASGIGYTYLIWWQWSLRATALAPLAFIFYEVLISEAVWGGGMGKFVLAKGWRVEYGLKVSRVNQQKGIDDYSMP